MSISDDSVADEQAQTGARANGFCGEEGLEQSGLDFWRDALSIIHYLYD